MAITYSNFLTQVRNYTEVDSNVLSDSILDEFIRNVEIRIANEVDYDDTRKYVTSTVVADQRYLNLPADVIVTRSIQVINGNERSFLDKRDTSFISEYAPDATSTGLPKYFANWDDTTIVMAPTPDQAYTIQVNYIKDPPHFTSTTNTYLATYQENLLLYAVLVEAFSYLKGPADMYNLYKNKYDESIQAFALQQMGRRRRSEYDSGVPRLKIPSPSP